MVEFGPNLVRQCRLPVVSCTSCASTRVFCCPAWPQSHFAIPSGYPASMSINLPSIPSFPQ
eukprot:6683163-Pyramimonas_sp.AAC.1